MEMGVGVVMDAEQEIAAADFSRIRLFEVQRNPAGEPVEDLTANWRVCSPKTLADGWWGGFSAVGYFFGRELHRELDVPIGLIDSSWGGTRIEPWTPASGFASVPALRNIAQVIKQQDSAYRTQTLPARMVEIEHWIAATPGSADCRGPVAAFAWLAAAPTRKRTRTHRVVQRYDPPTYSTGDPRRNLVPGRI